MPFLCWTTKEKRAKRKRVNKAHTANRHASELIVSTENHNKTNSECRKKREKKPHYWVIFHLFLYLCVGEGNDCTHNATVSVGSVNDTNRDSVVGPPLLLPGAITAIPLTRLQKSAWEKETSCGFDVATTWRLPTWSPLLSNPWVLFFVVTLNCWCGQIVSWLMARETYL